MASSQDRKRLKRYYRIVDSYLQAVAIEFNKYSKNKSTVKVNEKEGTVSLTIPAHIQFARYGRGPGKKPPFENILKFVREERIKFEGLSEKSTAMAIQFSIGKYGTKNHITNAPDFIEETLVEKYNQFETFFESELGNSMDEYLNKIFQNVKVIKNK